MVVLRRFHTTLDCSGELNVINSDLVCLRSLGAVAVMIRISALGVTVEGVCYAQGDVVSTRMVVGALGAAATSDSVRLFAYFC